MQNNKSFIKDKLTIILNHLNNLTFLLSQKKATHKTLIKIRSIRDHTEFTHKNSQYSFKYSL